VKAQPVADAVLAPHTPACQTRRRPFHCASVADASNLREKLLAERFA